MKENILILLCYGETLNILFISHNASELLKIFYLSNLDTAISWYLERISLAQETTVVLSPPYTRLEQKYTWRYQIRSKHCIDKVFSTWNILWYNPSEILLFSACRLLIRWHLSQTKSSGKNKDPKVLLNAKWAICLLIEWFRWFDHLVQNRWKYLLNVLNCLLIVKVIFKYRYTICMWSY